jgi:hypothetical protein
MSYNAHRSKESVERERLRTLAKALHALLGVAHYWSVERHDDERAATMRTIRRNLEQDFNFDLDGNDE